MNDVEFKDVEGYADILPGAIVHHYDSNSGHDWCIVSQVMTNGSEARYVLVSLHSGLCVSPHPRTIQELEGYIAFRDMEVYPACTITIAPKVAK